MNRRTSLKLLGSLAVSLSTGFAQGQPDLLRGLEATIYKSPTCGCCSGYVDFLKAQGVKVQVVLQEDLGSVKARFGIPAQAQSCHITLIGGYVVEGHVPLLALKKLLRERPKLDGIALPGMPIGTPGMPGTKTAAYQILSLYKSQLKPYMTL